MRLRVATARLGMYRFDAEGTQPGMRELLQIALPASARIGRERAGIAPLRLEGREHLLTDLEMLHSDRGAEPGLQRPATCQRCDRGLEHAGGKTAPARMRHCHRAPVACGNQ